MILCWIILIVGIVALVVGGILAYMFKTHYNDSFALEIAIPVLIILSIVTILIASVLLIVLPIDANQDLNTFITQKEYIESYEPTSEYDTVAIINKKIELNEWLYDAQYTKEHNPICSFYGDEILELEPIK